MKPFISDSTMDMPSSQIKQGLFILLTFFCLKAFSQEHLVNEPIWQLEVEGIDKIDVDGRGNIFFSTQNGHLKQYNESGDSINFYAPSFSTSISRLDAHWTVSIFLFYESQQRYEILDRFLNPLTNQSMADLGLTGLFSHATPGNNHSLWVYDETDLRLKKINYNNQQVLQEQALNVLIPESSLQLMQMVERKNLLFVRVSNEGVYIFDNQANYIKAIPITNNAPVFIENESIYFIKKNQLLKKNFISGNTTMLSLPENYRYTGLAVTNTRLLLTHPQGLMAFTRPRNF